MTGEYSTRLRKTAFVLPILGLSTTGERLMTRAARKIVIIGGGVIGSSIAWHLARAGAAADTVVIEPDSTYEYAATPRASGTVRRVFGLPENILMSGYAHEVYGDFERLLMIDGEPAAHVDMRIGGLLMMTAGAQRAASLEAIAAVQRNLGVNNAILDRAEIATRFPAVFAEDVDAALHSPDDGWIDPNGALQGFRRCARHLGIEYLEDRVTAIKVSDRFARSVTLASGTKLPTDIVINCANCWAPQVCRMVGLEVAIEPMRRLTFWFETRANVGPLPLLRDHLGVSVREEGRGWLSGVTNPDEPAGFNWDIDHAWFDEVVWPKVAHRVPAFEAAKVGRSWSGHYDMHRLDENPILGPWIGGVENFWLAAGFSGHGLMHAPAVGRGICELALHGRFETLDLSRLSFRRVIDGKPLRDAGPHS